MNPPAPTPGNFHRTLPLLAALALPVCCWVFLKQQHRDDLTSGPSRIPSAPAALLPGIPSATNLPQLPGVMSLPPATLASASKTPAAVIHRPPPDSRAVFTLADLKAQMPQREDGTFVMEVPTLHFSAADAAARRIMDGQRVETVAQLLSGDTGPRLSRRLTRCCTADAREFSVAAVLPPDFNAGTAGTWVKAAGRLRYRREIGGFAAVLEITSITEVPPPANPVLP